MEIILFYLYKQQIKNWARIDLNRKTFPLKALAHNFLYIYLRLIKIEVL